MIVFKGERCTSRQQFEILERGEGEVSRKSGRIGDEPARQIHDVGLCVVPREQLAGVSELLAHETNLVRLKHRKMDEKTAADGVRAIQMGENSRRAAAAGKVDGRLQCRLCWAVNTV